jgi:purine-binding chemotaxis protein CheW
MTTETFIPNTAAKAGKYLTFLLGREGYGISVLKVREIIRLCDVTPVPQMPEHVKGVINLRGKIIPVVDLRIKFNLASTAETEHTCIVVAQVTLDSGGKTMMGVVVDAVEEVVQIAVQDIEPTPEFGTQLDMSCIMGMAKIRGVIKALLDIDRVIGAEAHGQFARQAA